jgi:hypothetical protein
MIKFAIHNLKSEIDKTSLRNPPCLREGIGVVSSSIIGINAPVPYILAYFTLGYLAQFGQFVIWRTVLVEEKIYYI